MKIIHITSHFFPSIGGIEKHVMNIAKIQCELGHSVTVITGQYNGMNPVDNIDNIMVLRFPALRSKERKFLWHLRKLPLYFGADIIHIHSIMSINNIPSILIRKSKSVITLHGWGGIFPIPEKDILRTRSIKERFSIKSVSVGHFIDRWYGVASDKVIYGAIDRSVINRQTKSDKCYDICIFGRLEPDAGIKIYAEALKIFTKRHPSIKVCICGDGTLKDVLISSLDCEVVEFHGFVEDPLAYVGRSRLCFTSGYLGILEALSLNVQVFSVYDNPLKEDYLKLSPFAEYINIAGGSAELLSQLELRLSKDSLSSLVAPDFLLRHSWESVSNIYFELYREMADNN